MGKWLADSEPDEVKTETWLKPEIKTGESGYVKTEFPDEVAAMKKRDAEIDAEIAEEDREEGANLPTVSDSVSLDPAMVSDWERSGGADFHLGQVQSTAQALLDAFSSDERATVQSGFDALPDGVQTAVFTELAKAGQGRVQHASEAELEEFSSSPEGEVLTRFWRGKAERNVGIVRQRLSRIEAGMSKSEIESAWAFFEAMPSRAKIAVMCVLAG